MSATDAATLENLKLARDRLLARLNADQDATSYSVGDRSVSRAVLTRELERLEKLIARYERKAELGNYGGVSVSDLSDRD